MLFSFADNVISVLVPLAPRFASRCMGAVNSSVSTCAAFINGTDPIPVGPKTLYIVELFGAY